MQSRKKYSAAFKSKIALAAIKGEDTIATLAQKHGLNPSQINLWKKEALEGLQGIFEQKHPPKKDKDGEAGTEYLERKIGQLTIQFDFLKKSTRNTCRNQARNDRFRR